MCLFCTGHAILFVHTYILLADQTLQHYNDTVCMLLRLLRYVPCGTSFFYRLHGNWLAYSTLWNPLKIVVFHV